MSYTLNFRTDDIWAVESPLPLSEDSEPTYTCVFEDATTISISGGVMEVYKNGAGSDLSGTLTSGALATNSVNTVTLKKLQSLVGGNIYVVVLTCSVDSVVVSRKIQFNVQKSKDLQ